MPTVNCLVELTEMPFCVLSLADIEIVNLERVGFNLKNFDMAIVFKDFTRDVRPEGVTSEFDLRLAVMPRRSQTHSHTLASLPHLCTSDVF